MIPLNPNWAYAQLGFPSSGSQNNNNPRCEKNWKTQKIGAEREPSVIAVEILVKISHVTYWEGPPPPVPWNRPWKVEVLPASSIHSVHVGKCLKHSTGLPHGGPAGDVVSIWTDRYECMCVHTQLWSDIWFFVTPWSVARPAPLSMELSKLSTGVGCHFLWLDHNLSIHSPVDRYVRYLFLQLWITPIGIFNLNSCLFNVGKFL